MVTSVISCAIAVVSFIITSLVTYARLIKSIPDNDKLNSTLDGLSHKMDKIDERLTAQMTMQQSDIQDVRERLAVLEYAVKEEH